MNYENFFPLDWTPSDDVSGWYWCEKLDGVRAEWNGGRLISRGEKIIHAPRRIFEALPAGMPLSGELYAGRGGFEKVLTAFGCADPEDRRWQGVRFVAFDAPEAGPCTRARIDALFDVHHVEVSLWKPVRSNTHAELLFRRVVEAGEEPDGLTLKQLLHSIPLLWEEQRAKYGFSLAEVIYSCPAASASSYSAIHSHISF